MKTPLNIYKKNADKYTNRICIPKKVVEMLGRNYIMEIYKDKIILVPVK